MPNLQLTPVSKEIAIYYKGEKDYRGFDTYNSTAFKKAQVVMALDILDS